MVVLERCPYCGLMYCVAHKKYVDRCEECGKRYHKYTSYKSQQKKRPSFKREHRLEELRYDYMQLKQAGFKVPRDFE